MALAGTDAMAKTLLFADFGSNRGARAVALEWFANELNKRSDGSLEIEFHWGESLLSTSAVLNGISDRVADMGSVIGYEAPRQLRGYNVGDLPIDNADVWVGMSAMHLLSTSNAALKQEFERAGVVYITNYSTGPVQLICTKEVSKISDLKSIKLRGSGSYGKVFADLGAQVQSMSQPDVYQAMDSGLLECNQNYYYSMKAYKQYEIAAYVLELNWGQNMSFGIIMNEDSFANLTAAEKKAIRETGSDFIDYFAQLIMETNYQDRAAMLAGIDSKSIKVTTLKKNERQVLLATGKKYVDKWVSEADADGIDGKSILAAYQTHVDTFAGELDKKGYPWKR
jgi:TRAP-type C4-dicarboxylate transport system substrate-binding protein